MIKRLLRWLWCPGPCLFDLHEEGGITGLSGEKCGKYYHLRCRTCGVMKRQHFEALGWGYNGSGHFCSMKCAAEWADAKVEGTSDS